MSFRQVEIALISHNRSTVFFLLFYTIRSDKYEDALLDYVTNNKQVSARSSWFIKSTPRRRIHDDHAGV